MHNKYIMAFERWNLTNGLRALLRLQATQITKNEMKVVNYRITKPETIVEQWGSPNVYAEKWIYMKFEKWLNER